MKKMQRISLWMMLLLLFAHMVHAERLGVNINLVEQGGTFVDMIKEHHRWLDLNTWTPLEDNFFDELGWPTTDAMLMMDMRPVAFWANDVDDPEYYQVDRSGTYLGSFTGKADVQCWGEGDVSNVVYDEAENTTTFEFILGKPYKGGYGFLVLAFINSQRTADDAPASGVTDMKLIKPGYPANTEQTFINEFIDALTNPKFAAIRYKDFLGTDSSDPEYPGVMEWADRSLPEHASQKKIPAIGKNTGAAWEYVVELANLTQIDPWINIPVSATQDYIAQLADYLKDNLDPELNIYIESSNEVWNTAPAFQQSQYNKAQAADLGLGEHENHGRRTVEIAQVFADVYGQEALNNKIRVILCSHAPMLKWWVQGILDYLQDNYAPINQYIYALSCQSYFGGGADEGESVEKILADCRQSITDQIDESSDGQSGRKQWIAKAKDYNLPGGFCFYEGGPDHGGGSTTNMSNRILAERSEEMANVFKYNYNDGFFDIGGNLAIQFTLTSSYDRYGCWGLTDDIHNLDRNYKFQAAREILAKVSSVKKKEKIPTAINLEQNYPNPFNPSTTIRFFIPQAGRVQLKIFNGIGQHIATLMDEQADAGSYSVPFNAAHLSSGTYYYQLFVNDKIIRKKCLLIK